MMKKFNTIMLVAVGLLTAASGRAAEAEKPSPWQSTAFLGVTLTRGNSDTMLFTANAKTQKKEKDNEWAIGIAGAYGENDGEKNTETISGFGQYNRLFNERLFGYFRVDALHDGIADVKYRVALSPGVGYYFIKEKNTSLAAEVGPGVIFEDRGGDKQCYATLRVAERFEHKFNDKARMWQTAEFLPEVSRFSNFIINVEIGVAATLAKNLELSVVLQDTYVNEPAFERDQNDLKLISGITYKF